jgi:hypothetical protein
MDAYEFVLKVHQLRPWPVDPSSPELLAVGWQRGQTRGHIAAVSPKLTSKQYGVYQFNDEIRTVAKLRKVRHWVIAAHSSHCKRCHMLVARKRGMRR